MACSVLGRLQLSVWSAWVFSLRSGHAQVTVPQIVIFACFKRSSDNEKDDTKREDPMSQRNSEAIEEGEVASMQFSTRFAYESSIPALSLYVSWTRPLVLTKLWHWTGSNNCAYFDLAAQQFCRSAPERVPWISLRRLLLEKPPFTNLGLCLCVIGS